MKSYHFHVTMTHDRKIYLHITFDYFNFNIIYFRDDGLICKLSNKTLAFQNRFSIEDIMEYDNLVKEISP